MMTPQQAEEMADAVRERNLGLFWDARLKKRQRDYPRELLQYLESGGGLTLDEVDPLMICLSEFDLTSEEAEELPEILQAILQRIDDAAKRNVLIDEIEEALLKENLEKDGPVFYHDLKRGRQRWAKVVLAKLREGGSTTPGQVSGSKVNRAALALSLHYRIRSGEDELPDGFEKWNAEAVKNFGKQAGVSGQNFYQRHYLHLDQFDERKKKLKKNLSQTLLLLEPYPGAQATALAESNQPEKYHKK